MAGGEARVFASLCSVFVARLCEGSRCREFVSLSALALWKRERLRGLEMAGRYDVNPFDEEEEVNPFSVSVPAAEVPPGVY